MSKPAHIKGIIDFIMQSTPKYNTMFKYTRIGSQLANGKAWVWHRKKIEALDDKTIIMYYNFLKDE